MTDEKIDFALRAKDLERDIADLLYGEGPEVQGAVLASLMALWVAGHHPDVRGGALVHWLELVSKLIPIEEAMAFGPGGFPKAGAN